MASEIEYDLEKNRNEGLIVVTFAEFKEEAFKHGWIESESGLVWKTHEGLFLRIEASLDLLRCTVSLFPAHPFYVILPLWQDTKKAYAAVAEQFELQLLLLYRMIKDSSRCIKPKANRVPGALAGQLDVDDSFFDALSPDELKHWEK